MRKSLNIFINIKLYIRILLKNFKSYASNFSFYLRNNLNKILKTTFYLSNLYRIFKLN